MIDILQKVLAFLVVLSVLVVIHELGHYLVARWCGVKDSGKLFPGHGGALDRFDALLAAMPPAALAALAVLH